MKLFKDRASVLPQHKNRHAGKFCTQPWLNISGERSWWSAEKTFADAANSSIWCVTLHPLRCQEIDPPSSSSCIVSLHGTQNSPNLLLVTATDQGSRTTQTRGIAATDRKSESPHQCHVLTMNSSYVPNAWIGKESCKQ